MLLNILLGIQLIVCIALVGVILLQRSEGGALGMNSGPSGFMTARGAGNLLTRTTAILATLFFVLSISLTIVGNFTRREASVVDRIDPNALKIDPVAPAAPRPQPTAPMPQAPQPSLDDLAAPLPTSSAPESAPASAPARK